MTPAAKCIFCDATLGPKTKPEHILLSGLGGRKTTRWAICSECNNNFGGTIDDALTTQVKVLRNLLKMDSGTGRPPPMLKNISAGSERINIRSDGQPEIVKPPFTVTARPDGIADVQIQVQTQSDIQKILPHLAAKLRISEKALAEQIKRGEAAIIERRPGQAHLPISLGGEMPLRSVAKSCLVLFSTVVGNDAVKAAPFAAARDFVLRGDEEFYKTRVQIDSRDVPGLDDFKKQFGPFFNLIYVRSNEAGRVIGHFTLYNAISWQIVLTESGGPADQKVALASNPLEPATWCDDTSALPDISLEWLDTAERAYEIERARGRLVRMMEYHRDQSQESEIGRFYDDVLAKYSGDAERPITDPVVKKMMIGELALRVAMHALHLPYEQPLRPEDIEKMLQEKKLR